MVNSNQPYGRVDDGIGAGFIGGAVIGGLMYGGASGAASYAGGKAMASKGIDVGERFVNTVERANRHTANLTKKERPIRAGKIASNRVANEAINSLGNGKLSKASKFALGSTKRRTITGATSIIGTALMGAGIDAAND